MDDRLAANQRRWDQRVKSTLDDVAGFKAGRAELLPFEVAELGPLDGLRLLHLQCHLGLDTLDIARLHQTVRVTGVDFSAQAVDAAARLAVELRMADRARFVMCDVYRAADVLADQRFDVVYSGKGSLGWLPDLDRWAEVVHHVLAPGGFLYLAELHPVAAVLAEHQPVPVRDYFATAPEISEDDVAYRWQHPLGRVFKALLGVGFQLEFFHEWDSTVDDRLRFLVPGHLRGHGWPAGGGTLPLMYSLKALRPS